MLWDRPGWLRSGRLRRRGLGATNFFEAGAFLRTNDDVSFPDMQYEFLALTRKLVNGRLVPVPGFQFWMDLSRPHSRGQVRLRSADPAAPPSIVFNHLADRRDLTDLVAGIRLIREIVAQPAWTRYNRGELTPGPDATSDAELEAFVRAKLGTSYHPSGTARMGADMEAPVDPAGPIPRRRGPAGGRRVDHAEGRHGQPQRARDDDGREDRRPDPGPAGLGRSNTSTVYRRIRA